MGYTDEMAGIYTETMFYNVGTPKYFGTVTNLTLCCNNSVIGTVSRETFVVCKSSLRFSIYCNNF